MIKNISLLGLTPEDTKSYLLREFHAAKTPSYEETSNFKTEAEDSEVSDETYFKCLTSVASEKTRRRARLLECVMKELARRKENGIPLF